MKYKSWMGNIQAVFFSRHVLLTALVWLCAAFSFSNAQAETRSLKLYYVHTHEKAEIVFKKDGRYVASGLKKLNYFLRDWRRNEPTKMDPRLFDAVWQIYQSSGSKDYIHVLSAYRSPATNNMLRTRSANSGVAKNSQHTLGKAMDFYLPDVNLLRLRKIGMKQQAGGVGYYPTSGSPFIHVDVGSVRHWPRMQRRDLMALFPNGRTIHIPSDGVPLSGYAQAMADYKAGKLQTPQIMVAQDDTSKRSGGVFSSLFGRQKTAVTPPAPPQADTAAAGAPQMPSLPQDDVPVPTFAPLRDPEEIEDEAIPLIAENSANMPLAVPLPGEKPVSLAAQTTIAQVEQNNATAPGATVTTAPEMTAAAMLEIALPDQGPLPGLRPDAGPQPLDMMTTAYIAPQAKPVAAAKKDTVKTLIQNVEVISAPDDDFVSAEPKETLPQSAQIQSVIPDNQGKDNRQLLAMATQTTAKTDRLIHKHQQKDKAIASQTQHTGAAQDGGVIPVVAIKPLPQEVFSYGLQPGEAKKTSQSLSGSAVNFRKVERISGMR